MIIFTGAIGMIIFLCHWRIEQYAKTKVFESIEKIPYNRVGLILGTSKYVRSGQLNLYFLFRIEAAVLLYKHKKISFIIVSGDNRTTYYNEPKDMRNELIKRGVPRKLIFMDYAGLRTLDSVVRSKKIFSQQKITIISQRFHNKRAVYIASKYNIQAIGFNARDVTDLQHGLKVKFRELLARVRVFIDLYILGTKPRFLGKKILIK